GRKKMTRKKGALTALAILVLIVASGLVYLRGSGPPHIIRNNRVSLNATEFSFLPADLQTVPGEVSFSVINQGRFPHVLAIQGMGLRVSTPLIAPGETQTLRVKFERSGEYRVVCPLKGHAERGMVGSLQVRVES
ncbi:MAG: plastocyanin/azurin family copper-binding protein, partial [bacterium]